MSNTSTIRVSNVTKGRIAALSRSTGAPQTEIVEKAVDALERKLFFDEFNARYAELRRDPAVWREIQAERAVEGRAAADSSR